MPLTALPEQTRRLFGMRSLQDPRTFAYASIPPRPRNPLSLVNRLLLQPYTVARLGDVVLIVRRPHTHMGGSPLPRLPGENQWTV